MPPPRRRPRFLIGSPSQAVEGPATTARTHTARIVVGAHEARLYRHAGRPPVGPRHVGILTAGAAGTADPTPGRLAATGDAVVRQGDAGGAVPREAGAGPELPAVAGRSWQGGCLGSPDTETRTDASATRVDDLRTRISAAAFAAQGDLTGDKAADLTAVRNDGTPHAYPGKGDGTLTTQAPVTLGGATWSTAEHLA